MHVMDFHITFAVSDFEINIENALFRDTLL